MAKASEGAILPVHGVLTLPSVNVDSYNLEVEDADGFIGDKANKGAFWNIVDKWRQPLRDLGGDPFADKPTDEISKKILDELLAKGSPDAAGIVESAVEDFAQQLAKVIKRFSKQKAWKDTECIVFGGGFRASRVGELAIGRTAMLLKADGIDTDIELIRHHPDEAGLVGVAHLLPAWMLAGYNAILAVDVGGTNIRVGIIDLRLSKGEDFPEAGVWQSHLWRHGDEDVDRDEAIQRLVEMLEDLIKTAHKERILLAPMIGIGCPGIIEQDGSIVRGAQNLPGNWESRRFNLPRAIRDGIPKIGEHETLVVMHNDAVIQGLSHLPETQNRKRWGVLTIGTGLGNARFSNRAKEPN